MTTEIQPPRCVAMHELVARRLRDAEAQRAPIEPLAAVTGTPLTVEDAYAIQTLNTTGRVQAGARIVGRKIGLTSAPMQAALGVDEPDYGVIFADMLVEGIAVDAAQLIQPKAEAEIGVRLGDELRGPGVTTQQALAAIDAVVPALEIIDSRIEDWRIGLVDTVADNASAARVVLGDRLTPPAGLDLATLGVAVWVNGELAASGAGAAALGHPARCVAWLANKLARFGEQLRAGDLILPGALHAAIDVRGGDVVRADFAHIGSVRAHFTEAAR